MDRICDIMHKGVICCDPSDSLKFAAEIMADNQIRAVVVKDSMGEVWDWIWDNFHFLLLGVLIVVFIVILRVKGRS